MKSFWIVAVLVCVVLASGVWAQSAATFSARASGMGGAAIGVADDGAAWFQNPGGLASLGVAAKEGSEYANDVMGVYADMDDSSAWLLSWSGWKPSDAIGFGAGYADLENAGNVFGAGFGAGFKTIPLSLGVNIQCINPDNEASDPAYPAQVGIGDLDDDQTILNLGAMYSFDQGEDKAPVRVGLLVQDITDELGTNPIWNAGLGWKPAQDWLVAVDVTDLTDELGLDIGISGGVEFMFGNLQEWRGRAGLMDIGEDHRATLGLGYVAKQWRADLSWIDSDPESTWAVGVGVNL